MKSSAAACREDARVGRSGPGDPGAARPLGGRAGPAPALWAPDRAPRFHRVPVAFAACF